MKIGIICAGDDEVAPILSMMKIEKISHKAMLKFYEGKLENQNIVTLFSGVCKVNAAIAAQILIDTYGCDMIINGGTAGSMDQHLKPFDLVVSTKAAYHDVDEEILTDFHPRMKSCYFQADEKLLSVARKVAEKYMQNTPVFGTMVTGEAFIEENEKKKMTEKYEALSVDMETASIAHVCYVNEIPFLAVRAITDCADEEAKDNFEENCKKASEKSAEFVRLLLKEWKE